VPGRAAARAAFVLGVAYALVSAYWGAGGEALLGTIGGELARRGRAGDPGLLAVVWLTVALKLAAAVLGLLAVRAAPPRRARGAAWAAAGILTLYGGVLTAAGLLVESGAIDPAADADRRALRWHAFLWDPWFLLWGLLMGAALVRSRPAARR
jgi:uncharacterized protein DUF3995